LTLSTIETRTLDGIAEASGRWWPGAPGAYPTSLATLLASMGGYYGRVGDYQRAIDYARRATS
jgi:hypothetical protein